LSVTFTPTLIYHLSTHDHLAMQAMVWPCMVRFRAIWFGAVWFGASYTNLRWPQTLRHQMQRKQPLLAFQ